MAPSVRPVIETHGGFTLHNGVIPAARAVGYRWEVVRIAGRDGGPEAVALTVTRADALALIETLLALNVAELAEQEKQ